MTFNHPARRSCAGPASIAVLMVVTAASLGLLLSACSDSPPTGPVPQITEAHYDRDITDDGMAKLSGKVTVKFDRDFVLAPSKTPLVSSFEFSLPAGADGPAKRVLPGTAERSKTNPRLVTLTVDRIFYDGATVSVEQKTFDAKATGTLKAEVATDFTPTFALLASSALAPTNQALFDTAKQAEVKPEDRDPVAMRVTLTAFLTKLGMPPADRDKALARYDTMPPDIVTSPKLRAALAGLSGTFAEPAIDYLLTAGNCTNQVAAKIAFQDPPNAAKLLANSTRDRSGRRVISVSPRLEGERFELLMPILAHEAIHCDNVDGRFEEIAATAIDTFLFMQLLAVSPDLASTPTLLSREDSIDAIALINSGRRLPESIGVLRSVGVTRALPGSGSTAPAFAEFVAAAYSQIDYNESPDEPLAQAYVQTLAKQAGMPVASAFNLKYLDELLGRAIDGRVMANALAIFGLGPAS